MAKSTGKITLRFPFKGRNTNYGYELTPEGFCIDCLNVLPFDPRGQRLRGGQRAGTGKLTTLPLVTGKPVKRLHQAVLPAAEATDGTPLSSGTFSHNDARLIADFDYTGVERDSKFRVTSSDTFQPFCNGFVVDDPFTYDDPALMLVELNARARHRATVTNSRAFAEAALINRTLAVDHSYTFQAGGNAQLNAALWSVRGEDTTTTTASETDGVLQRTGPPAFAQANSAASILYARVWCFLVDPTFTTLGSAYGVRAKISATGGTGSLNLVVRANTAGTKPNEGIRARFEANTVKLQKYSAGAWTTVTSTTAPYSATNGDTPVVELECDGNLFTVRVDGIDQLSATITDFATNTGVAFLFDNTSATAPNGWYNFDVLSYADSNPADNFDLIADFEMGGNVNGDNGAAWIYAKADGAPFTNANNSVAFTWTPTGMGLSIDAGAVHASYTSARAFTNGQVYQFKLRVVGNRIRCYVDDAVVFDHTVTLTAISANTNHGFGLGRDLNTVAQGGTATAGFVNFQVTTAGTDATDRLVKLLAVCDGSVFVGTAPTSLAMATNGNRPLAHGPSYWPHSADVDNKVYLVDGISAVKYLDMTTDTVSTLVASVGTVPTGCRVCCVWRTRLVVANQKSFPQNIYMSRAGDPTDWEFGKDDAQAAVALNLSDTAGQVGEPIYALIPFRDDAMIVGCDHSIYLLDGDPADGGSVLQVSGDTGILTKDSWCFDPQGNLWFLGNGGLYKMSPQAGSIPVKVSEGRERAFATGISRASSVATLSWDRDRNGVWINITSKVDGSHFGLWYDAECDPAGGFFPQQFPIQQGPQSALIFDGDGPSDRYPIWGGFDGHLRSINSTNVRDDGNAINSFVYLLAGRPGGFVGEARLTDMECTFGELPDGYSSAAWNVNVAIYAGRSVHEAYTAPRLTAAANFPVAGRQLHRRQRVNGSAFVVKVYNGNDGDFWTLEEILLTFQQGGRNR